MTPRCAGASSPVNRHLSRFLYLLLERPRIVGDVGLRVARSMPLLAAGRSRAWARRPSRIHVRVALEPAGGAAGIGVGRAARALGAAGSGGGARSTPGYPVVAHVAVGIIGRSACIHLLPTVHLAAPRAGR